MAKEIKLWDNYIVVGEVQKNHRTRIRVALATRDGFRYMVLREMYRKKSTGEWKFGRDGINVPLTAPLDDGMRTITPLAALLKVMQDEIPRLKSMELADENNAVYMEGKK